MDGGATGDAALVSAQVGDASVTVADVEFPMQQRGTGTVIHFPVPEQLARTAVPVFAQIRSSAPIDHVSVFYRGPGARRYTELRMSAMGQQFRLPSGYGALIPCDDIFPPRLEYYVAAYDSSGAPNGTAGTAEAPSAGACCSSAASRWIALSATRSDGTRTMNAPRLRHRVASRGDIRMTQHPRARRSPAATPALSCLRANGRY